MNVVWYRVTDSLHKNSGPPLLLSPSTIFLIFSSIMISTGFVLFWAFKLPWFSMTFSMTYPSFPWPKFDHFLGNHLPLWVCFYYFLCKKTQFILYFLINIISHDFPWPTPKFHDFPGLENEILKFHDFPGYPWPIWTLLPHYICTWSLMASPLSSIQNCLRCSYFHTPSSWPSGDSKMASMFVKSALICCCIYWQNKQELFATTLNTCLLRAHFIVKDWSVLHFGSGRSGGGSPLILLD